MNDDAKGYAACIWAGCGILAIFGGVFHKDPTALAIVFFAVTLGLKEEK